MTINNKKSLRKKIIALRKKMSSTEIEDKSRIISDKVMKLATYKRSRIIMSYMSFRNEVDTDYFNTRVLEKWKDTMHPKNNPRDWEYGINKSSKT